MPDQPFREVKRTLDGAERVYECEALSVTPRLAIVRFVFSDPLNAGGVTFPVGAFTVGFFWRTRTYNLYHMLAASGSVIADRFDVVDRVRIRPDGVRYDDLLLDFWLYPDGRLREEDADEVAAAVSNGLLSPGRQATIERTRALLQHHARRIVDRAMAEIPHSAASKLDAEPQ